MRGLRAIALVGILPGAIVAAAYLLVLSGRLYQHWDLRTAIVLGMAAWGIVGVFELWHVYGRVSRNRTGVERTPVSPRVLLLVWALTLLPIAAWKIDERPRTAVFLGLVALYSFARAFGLLRYISRRPTAPPRASVAHVSHRARARGGERARTRRSPVPSSASS